MTFGMHFSKWKRLAVAACVTASVIGGFVHTADAAGKPGMVSAKGGLKFQGEVDETSVPGKVIIVQADGKKVEIFKSIVENIAYFDTPKAEFDARLASLGRQDVSGRVALARWAMSKNELELAGQALAAARAIDPNNAEASAMQRQLDAKMPKPETKPATMPATQPGTGPVVETPKVNKGPAIRMLTAEEIQHVRIREMKSTDKLRASVPPATRKKAIDSGLLPANQASRLSQPELAMLILQQGTPELQSEVKILSDPAALAEYKSRLNKVIVSGCSATNCHGGQEPGKFKLFAEGTEEAALTNFVILAKYDRTDEGVSRLMIDRTQPASSVLLSYMLPANLSRLPHPEVAGMKPVARTVNDPSFLAFQNWLGNVLPVATQRYDDIDLTQPPKDDKAGAKPAAQ